MEVLSQFIVIIIMGICLCLGYIIKKSLDFIPNKYIPLIMAVIGTILNIWLKGWKFSPEILLGGMASGLASTGAFELARNMTTKDISTEADKNTDKDTQNNH